MLCPCCNSELEEIGSNSKWKYYKCKKCRYWTSRTLTGDFPSFEYLNSPTFDEDANSSWGLMVKEAKMIMKHKFDIINQDSRGIFLDIGCSEGVYVAASESLGWKAFGFEVDVEKVKRARDRGLNVMVPDYDCFEFQSVDFIMLRHTIEHIPEFISVLKLATKYLKKGGILCVETPNQASFKSLLVRGSIKNERYLGHIYPHTHIHAFEPRTYEFIGRRLGLSLKNVLTYSPNDPSWSFMSLYTKKGLVPIVHKITSRLGFGENIAVFYTN